LNKGRGVGHPEKLELRRHTKPLPHLPVRAGSKVDECIEAMEKLGIPPDATRDEAGDTLRGHGYRFGNSLLGPALKARRPSPPLGRRTPWTSETAVQNIRPPSVPIHPP
jgi:hypothetical protein